ncbi:ribosome maturation factor RimM [Alkalihalophilus pseudofirmus]|uniref:ribosome maturation factor RimM n=1 Tax=Alkalihalobacterium alkalinitrilicum TaxID=427920 RepID=UPI00094BFBE4|nr:ribosome maturation factor RimM [Alkalihalobacterium alkalinitrilicum]OLO40870.1 ribosome maturation factor RimM [Alkalihalophilus pseudofirmus]
MTKWFKVGKIVNTHGIRGEVRVISTTDFEEERYAIGAELFIEHPEFREMVRVIVETHRKHKNFDLLTFEGYTNISHVEKFKGGSLKVSEDALSELDEGEFYYHEIIGCQVFTEDGLELGKIKEVLSPGANDVWVIQSKTGGKDILIPYIDDVVKEVNIAEKKVIIELLEGLI